MLIGSMLAIWLDFRSNAPLRESTDGTKMLRDWLPENIKIPEVATNTMMMTFVITCVMAQWAVYSSRRNDSKHTSLALGVVLLTEIALVNAQLAIYSQMGIGVRDGSYMTMFYAVTATMLAIIIVCMGFTILAMFRSIAGRAGDRDLVSAHALYCYAVSAIFNRDYPVIQCFTLMMVVVFVVCNLIVDLLNAALDPRIRRHEGAHA